MDLAAHAEIAVLEPGFKGPVPAGEFLLQPAGGRPEPGHRCLAWVHQLAELQSGLGGFMARFRSSFAASRSELVVAPSQAVAESLVRYLRVEPGRLAVVQPGLDPGFGRTSREEAERARADFGLPERYLLAYGDADLARRAWAGATTPAEGAGLVLEADLRPPPDHLPALLSGAVGVLFCERLAGNPIRALEAMACGSPPAVGDDGAYPEVVRDGGLTVRAGDLSDWSEAISALYRSRPLRSQLSRRGREIAAAFTAERAARRVLELLEPGDRVAVDQRVDPRDRDRGH